MIPGYQIFKKNYSVKLRNFFFLFFFFFFVKKKNLKLHLLLNWLMHWWVMNSPWERPKGQSRSGETQLNRPSYCPARPCCTVSPLLILFLPIPNPEAKGGTHTFPSLASCRWFALPFHSPTVTTEMRNSSYSSALSSLPKFSIPASNLGNELRFPYKRERRQKMA